MLKSRLWRRSGLVLCALGIALLLLDEVLPVEIAFPSSSRAHLRVVATTSPEWSWASGSLLLLLGVVALVRSSKLRKSGA